MCKDNRKPTLEVLLVVAVAALLHPATERSRAETTTPGLQQTDEPLQRFQAAHPATATSRDRDGGITRVFGKAFGGGRSPAAAAEQFRRDFAPMFGAEPDELVPAAIGRGPGNTLPIMFDADTGRFRFTAAYYRQQRNGVDVFGSRLVLLTRNEPGHPLVLANGQLRDLGNFAVDANARQRPMAEPVRQSVLEHGEHLARLNGGRAQVIESSKVIFAGVDGTRSAPRLADDAIVQVGPEKWRIVADAETGAVLQEQSLICTIDLTGVVNGNATQGIGADICEPEAIEPLPYLQVEVNDTMLTTDADGQFLATDVEPGPVFLSAMLRGKWFDVFNHAGADMEVVRFALPPGPTELTFNLSNLDPLQRAQVNAYVGANQARDFALQFNPYYPTLGAEGFPINVNRDDQFCPGNAWYDIVNPSLNFCRAGVTDTKQPRPNTAFSSIIYHEFGHHLVEMAGSGQGQYGEGVGDAISTIMLDTPLLGFGFFDNCTDALRNADNDMQVPCDGPIHYCGQTLSGCIWDTREELVNTEPENYQDILGNLMINSILLHTSSVIESDLVVDFLTLDDDNGNIFDGTPHFDEIATGFGSHGMNIPQLDPIGFEFPDGVPAYAAPDGSTTVRVRVVPISGQPEAGEAWMTYTMDDDETTVALDTTAQQNEYIATLPSGDCGERIDYSFSAMAMNGSTLTSPFDAPDRLYTSFAAFDSATTTHLDCESGDGWIAEPLDATAGFWERGVPVLDIQTNDSPSADSDGSGQCWLTENAAGNSDVDNGSVRLTTPQLDLEGGPAIVSYDWFLRLSDQNPDTNDRMMVELSDGSGPWVEILRHTEDGGFNWNTQQITPQQMSDAGINSSGTVRLRFTVSDLTPQSMVEAAIDNVRVELLACDPVGPESDLTGDGAVDVFDLLALLANWGTDGPGAGLAEPDDLVDVFDLLELLADWTG